VHERIAESGREPLGRRALEPALVDRARDDLLRFGAGRRTAEGWGRASGVLSTGGRERELYHRSPREIDYSRLTRCCVDPRDAKGASIGAVDSAVANGFVLDADQWTLKFFAEPAGVQGLAVGLLALAALRRRRRTGARS
jgi:hypothetical protein